MKYQIIDSKSDPKEEIYRTTENTKYNQYFLKTGIKDPKQCFPANKPVQERNIGLTSQDVEADSMLKGYGTPLSRTVGVRPRPEVKIPDWIADCNQNFDRMYRNTKGDKSLTETDISGYNFQYLPYEIDNYDPRSFVNSRQMIKDIQEQNSKKL